MLLAACPLGMGCEMEAGSETPSGTPTTAAPSSKEAVSTARRGYEIPIPQIEYWAGTRTLKYSYEMRFDPPLQPDGPPRLHRNGWARAYYASGQLEREGAYRYVPDRDQSERVGIWTYYRADGEVDRTEDRGGEAIWTGPDQRITPPNTSM